MQRVLLVGRGEPERGGIAAYLRTLMASDLTQRHTVRFLNLTRDAEPRGGRLNLHNLQRTVADALAVWRAARGCDVVHIHSALAPAVTLVRAGVLVGVARLRGARTIVHAHGGRLVSWSTTPSRRMLVRCCLRPAVAVVAVAGSVADVLAGVVRADRLSVIPNGVATDTFSPAGGAEATLAPQAGGRHRSDGSPRVLYAGLLTPRKGVLDLLEASDLVRTRGFAHELWLVGGTPDEGVEAEHQVRAAIPPHGVTLLGSVEPGRMPEVYRACDIFCLPSWWEAAPLTVLEAMASGLPVVATDVGDVPRMVDQRVGVLVPPRRPERLADALAELLSDAPRRDRLGCAARDRVITEFGLDEMVTQVGDLYERVAEGR